ncbi:MAG: ATPase, T2SS/T4P/T4SS family [Candidatus Dormibacteraeota bacterium]|nr:ATPase, T2SS/T4P/T4SS family [Candidatus Dormibacteraeota bacterium]
MSTPALLSSGGSPDFVRNVELGLLPEVQSKLAGRLASRADPELKPDDRGWILSLVQSEIQAYHTAAPHRHLPVLTAEGYEEVKRRLIARLGPLGPIAELLSDPLIEEVLINGPEEVLVVKDGVEQDAQVRFESEDALLATVQRLLGSGAAHIDRASPMVTATMEDGSRINAVLPPVAMPMAVTIRRHQLARFGRLTDLSRVGTLPWELAPLLQTAVRARLNLIVSGGTGSGKTTLLRLLISEVPAWERIITIEDQRELHLRTARGGRRNTISLEARDPNTEGTGEVTIQQLVRNALRQRPDRIFVGECRGPEALDVVDAMGTGHDGSGTTLHANSARDALQRLAGLVRRHPAQARADPAAIARELAAKVDLVVHLTRIRRPDGADQRVIQAVGFVTGQVEGDLPILETLCHHNRARGTWEWDVPRLDDLPAKIQDKLDSAGVAAASWFGGMPEPGVRGMS